MFGLEKLKEYPKAKRFNLDMLELIEDIPLNRTTMNQLKRTSLSIPINIAEGQGRKTAAD